MSREQVLRDRVTLIDGVLYWRSSGKPVFLQPDKDGYQKFTICLRCNGGKTALYYAAHRAIWFLHYGEWPKYTIDHINRVKTDNRIENLRDVTFTENQRNRADRLAKQGAAVPHFATELRLVGADPLASATGARFTAPLGERPTIQSLR